MYWNKLRWVFALTGFLFSTDVLHAQTINNFSGWAAWFSSIRINSKLSIHFDGQVRSNHAWKEVQTVLIRPGLNYHISKKQIAGAGYAFIDARRRINGISGWAAEHRIWEQYIFNQSFSVHRHFTTLQHRLRLEQRFVSKSEVQGDGLKTTDHLFSQRLRYFARSIFPLQQASIFKKGAYISLQNEVMVNISNSAATNGKFFDQNRLYTSFGYRLSPKTDIEAGYMYQRLAGRADISTNNTILQVAIYSRL